MHNFKKACVTTAALVLLVCLLCSLVTAPYFGGTYYYYEDAALRQELAGTIDTLVVGASYSNWGIDPRILDAELGCNSYNLSSCLQTMKGRYYLLEKELERNPVKTVIMEVSAYSLTRNRQEEGPEGDIYVLGRLDSLPERLKFSLTHFTPGEYTQILHDTMNRGLYGWKELLRGGESQLDRDAKGLHTYAFVDQLIYLSQLDAIQQTEPLPMELNPENVLYFEKCMDLCREKGVRVVLVATPITGRAILHYTGYDELVQTYRDYAEQYDCPYFDFNLYRRKIWEIRDYDSYMDLQHLSDRGVERFTTILADFLRRDAAGEDLSEQFFDTYEEAGAEVIRRTYD